jgi:hypothetical protein
MVFLPLLAADFSDRLHYHNGLDVLPSQRFFL